MLEACWSLDPQLNSVAEDSSGDDEPTAAVGALEELSPSELSVRMADCSSSIVIIDVRRPAHFYNGHIRGAVSVCLGPAAMRATHAAAALSDVEQDEGLDAGARHALQQLLPLAELVAIYDGGVSTGQREGPAFHLGDLLAADGGAPVAVIRGGYGAFAKQHASLCVAPQPSAGHRSAAGVLELTPRGAGSAMPACCCFETDGGRFKLWVGGARDAADRSLLERHGITHVINVAKELPSRFRGSNDCSGRGLLRYLRLGVLDECDADLYSHLDVCVAFLDEARAAALDASASTEQGHDDGHGALVHCYMGRSRSVTVAAAYVASVLGCSSSEALEAVRGRRPDARPNAGFVRQLEAWVRERQAARAATAPLTPTPTPTLLRSLHVGGLPTSVTLYCNGTLLDSLSAGAPVGAPVLTVGWPDEAAAQSQDAELRRVSCAFRRLGDSKADGSASHKVSFMLRARESGGIDEIDFGRTLEGVGEAEAAAVRRAVVDFLRSHVLEAWRGLVPELESVEGRFYVRGNGRICTATRSDTPPSPLSSCSLSHRCWSGARPPR